MSLNMTSQELYNSNDKVASIGIIAAFVGTFVGLIVLAFILVWCFKWVANNAFGCHLDPIHGKSHLLRGPCLRNGIRAHEIVGLLQVLRNNTPFALYRRARLHIKEKRERRQQKQNDLEKAQSSRSTQPSMFTLAYSSDADREQYYSSYKPSSSFSQNHPTIGKPKPVLTQHNEAWWKETMEGSDLATVIRSMQQAAYSRRASNV
jgi:hypothetical protein